MSAPLLSVRGLKVHFPVATGRLFAEKPVVRAVDGVDFDLAEGETLGIVGESGCGKSTTGNAILGLAPVTEGEILFDGRDVAGLTGRDRQALWRDLQVVFQDPVSALDPKRTIAQSIAEPLEIHGVARASRKARVDELMELVGLRATQRDRYPNELSGGQRQRVVIARALALEPRVVICDEAVSALDVSIQSQVLNLLLRLQRDLGLSYLFISHDLSVVRHIADRIAVMYLGTVAEEAPTDELFRRPLHPYTEALLAAVPLPDPVAERAKTARPLQGDVPNPMDMPPGCPFAARCPLREEGCDQIRPQPIEVGPGHRLACHVREREITGSSALDRQGT
ncbi:ABC transporter ATP-binding protein [Allosediminivita pacifica]|uniref:Peptide/nickel transport system ATP-binding protein/oligopeptide transport system ATP-binding protein n=1 Tax=Allosediminivita pacifica TaxID=1267769 RepID=A0A2T6AY79_9RHOB|nr:oligopeptide/dipeptide ABC transporter ATP-binding protein [Allosediminivita pacifica]PTX48768.1 peptide/nickel transport system ATP-binding protein/oligopeptide transport system ATP-binding protein [Allosediminivita pacifica]GGB08073.1 peptide ABC transporter ATP-binding protein [Allosediminivita pacifica]